MAHDINFFDNSTGEIIGGFSGFADGSWYKVLDADNCYAGVSGNGNSIFKTATQMEDAIRVVKTFKAIQNYPDPNRFPNIFFTLQNWIENNPDGQIRVCFF